MPSSQRFVRKSAYLEHGSSGDEGAQIAQLQLRVVGSPEQHRHARQTPQLRSRTKQPSAVSCRGHNMGLAIQRHPQAGKTSTLVDTAKQESANTYDSHQTVCVTAPERLHFRGSCHTVR